MGQDDQFEAFYKLLKRGDIMGLRRLIASGGNVNCTNRGGWTPLMWAKGNTAIVRLLLDAGADVNTLNSGGVSPLAMAAQTGKVKAVALLLRAGARIDVTPYGCSLLTYTLTGDGRNHSRIFEMLTEAGATTFHGNTHLSSYPAGFGPVE